MKKYMILGAALLAMTAMTAFSAAGNSPAGQSQPDENGTIVKVGDTAPDFRVTMVDGTQTSLSDYRGKVVLLMFWATWCPPCQREMKRVGADIVDRFAGKEFVFLPISRGETLEKVTGFRQANSYTFPMGLDLETQIFKKFASKSIPRNFVIDRDGKITRIEIGYNAEAFDDMVAVIEKMLKHKK